MLKVQWATKVIILNVQRGYKSYNAESAVGYKSYNSESAVGLQKL